MAIFTFDGIDNLVGTMQKADMFDDETQMELLTAGAKHLSDIIIEESGRAPYRLKWVSSKLSRSRKLKKDKNGNPYIVVSVRGKNERGERNATVAFVLNYGRAEEYGKIHGSYFWTRAVHRSEQTIKPIYEEIINEKLEERGLV